jgi:DNA-binding response OmpR family regulator
MKVLVVEDDAKTGAYIQRSLEEHGHVLDLASNGPDGLFLATSTTYDIVVSTACCRSLTVCLWSRPCALPA